MSVLVRQVPPVVDALVGRIVESVHPLRIIIFGSAARGEMRPDSDIDVMVVMPDGTHRLKTVHNLYRQIFDIGYPIDIVVTTPSVLAKHKDNPGLIYRSVLTEGKEVYAS